jgi:hypothetical protein
MAKAKRMHSTTPRRTAPLPTNHRLQPSSGTMSKPGADALALQYLEIDVSDLCRAVKVISSVLADQLADPFGGEPVTSDYGLEVQTFRIDADMLRFAVDHAAELALAVSHKMK